MEDIYEDDDEMEDIYEDDDYFAFPVVYKEWTKEETEELINKLKYLKTEKHFIIVQGWNNVQAYLGTQIGQEEIKKMGIKRCKRGVGRGHKTTYFIPYQILIKRLIQNQRKIKALKRSVEIIRRRLIRDPKMKEYLEKALLENK